MNVEGSSQTLLCKGRIQSLRFRVEGCLPSGLVVLKSILITLSQQSAMNIGDH